MSVELYLLPSELVASDPEHARAFLDREARSITTPPTVIEQANESRKRKLADLLLTLKPTFREFNIRHDEIAKFEKISVEEARRKYRYIEISGSGIQFTFFDR